MNRITCAVVDWWFWNWIEKPVIYKNYMAGPFWSDKPIRCQKCERDLSEDEIKYTSISDGWGNCYTSASAKCKICKNNL